MPEASLFLLQAPLFLSLLLDLLSTSSRLYQHFFRWQHLSSVFSLLTLSLSLHFLFPLFPTFFSLLFTAFSPLFVLFYFPLSPFLLQLLSTIASVPLERVYCQIWGYLRIPTSLRFPRIFPSMSVQYFLRDNVDSIKARCS